MTHLSTARAGALLRLVLVPLTLFTLHCLPATASAQTDADSKENDPLTTYRDKNRVILVFAPSDNDPQFTQQLSALKNKTELDDRQLVVLPVLADDKAAGKSLTYLQNKFNDGKAAFSVVLIGKDGHQAFQSAEAVPAETIYAKIDAMPMRKDEMKEKVTGSGSKEKSDSKTSRPDHD